MTDRYNGLLKGGWNLEVGKDSLDEGAYKILVVIEKVDDGEVAETLEDRS